MTTTARLLPKEHGAYAQLGFPLTTGLALGGPSLPAIVLGTAAVVLFLANEPVAVLLGIRGKRLKEQQADVARRRAGLLLGSGGVLGVTGLALGWPAIWPGVLLPALAGLLLVPVVLVGKQKSLPGEILVLTAFSTLVLPLAAASGADPLRAGLATGVWWTSFALATLEVHAIKVRIKKRSRYGWTRWVSPLAAAAVLAAALWATLGQGGPQVAPAAAALLPPALAILVISLLRVHPRHLKKVGWTLVGANALTLVLLLQG